MDQLSRVAVHAPSGLFVASSDVLLDFPAEGLDWSHPGVTGLGIAADVTFAPRHGVYQLATDGFTVETFIQKGNPDQLQAAGALRSDQTVLLDSGVVFFCRDTTETLLGFHVTPPLDACTYLGVDNGAPPLRFELYSDILIAMAQSTRYEDYLEMPIADPQPERVRHARKILWNTLRPFSFRACAAEQGRFIHLGTIPEYLSFLHSPTDYTRALGFCSQAHCHVDDPHPAPDCVLINSIFTGTGHAEAHALVEHSNLQGNWFVGEGAIGSGIRSCPGIHIQPGMVVQETQLEADRQGRKQRIFTVYGVNDDFQSASTFVHQSIDHFLERAEISAADIWLSIPPSDRCLWNARLFPILDEEDDPSLSLWLQQDAKPSSETLQRWRNAQRLSLADVLQLADPMSEFSWRQELAFQIDTHWIEAVLSQNRGDCLRPVLERFARSGRTEILHTLDRLAARLSPHQCARVFSTVADVLAALAGSEGGLRSGPARNANWQQAFDWLDQGRMAEAVEEMVKIRRRWMESAEFLIRGARHYEGAAQVLVRKAVETARVDHENSPPAPVGQWVTAEAPARIDLAGGWSDTPPITYEHGGEVINAAVTVDGHCPITARCRRIAEPVLRIRMAGLENELVCRTRADLENYQQPLAPGALIKAALIGMDVVFPHSPQPLVEQWERWGGGLEIETDVSLPIGSGLGTSSILAGTLIHAVGNAIGIRYDPRSMVHLVLRLEQILTTGGGWQDQVGGLLPGIKASHSPASLPVQVDWEILQPPDEFLRTLEQHLLLLYTGRIRLARNLLQDVIRRWHARLPAMVSLADDLTRNARRMREAIMQGDLEAIGTCLSTYWDQKKRMTEGAEPSHVAQLIHDLQPHVFGVSMCGAGGGGFMVLLTRAPHAQADIQSVLDTHQGTHEYTIHALGIDRRGLALRFQF